MRERIQKNTVIEWIEPTLTKGTFSRVLHLTPDGEQVVIYPLDEETGLPYVKSIDEIVSALEDKQACIRTVDPFGTPLLTEEVLKQKDRELRDRAWEAIATLVRDTPTIFCSEKRSVLIADAADLHQTQRKYIWKWLRKYWRYGMVKNSLLPRFNDCGGRGKRKSCTESVKRGRPAFRSLDDPEKAGINIDDNHLSLIKLAIDRYYNTSDKNPITRAHRLMIENHYNVGYQIVDGVPEPILPPPEEYPTYEQFNYWLKRLVSPENSLRARIGDREFNLTSRPILKDSTQDAFGPGHIYQIDSTIADIYLVSSLMRGRIIGRPVLYFVVDVFTRMIVGFYIGLEGPSWVSAMMALANTAMDKVELCRQYGIELQAGIWPTSMFCQQLIADRAEILGYNSDVLSDDFGIIITNTPPYRADFKGIVEQTFHKANCKTIHWQPGAVKERFRERGQKDHRLDATLTLKEFTAIIIRMILHHNCNHYVNDYPFSEDMIAAEVKSIPVELWNWGMKYRTGCLQQHSFQKVMLGLMPSGQATVYGDGIHFKGLYYTCDEAINEDWYVKARKRTYKVKVSYDPRCMDRIFIVNDEQNLIQCHLLEKSKMFADHYDEDVLEYRALQTIEQPEQKHEELQGESGMNAQVKAIVSEAKEKTAAALAAQGEVSMAARVGAINDNRAEEKARLGEEEALILVSSATGDGLVPDRSEEGTAYDEVPIGGRDTRRLEMLRKQRKGGVYNMRNRITGRKVDAVYSDCPDPTHNGNPFIMALHPSLGEEKAASLMRRLPKFHKAIREKDTSFRAEALMKALDYIEPLPPLLELEQKISRLIRHGYVGRNRNTAAWAKQLREGFKDLDFERGGAEYVPSIRSNVTGFNIFGVSGSGKSTAIESVLDLFDQVIEHNVFDGESFEQKQLTWLKFECPFDGSTKGMCVDFFSEVDELLGTDYSQTWGSPRKSANQMLAPMARVAFLHGLGVLVIDEIQRLSLMKSGGADKMLNFFVQLTNKIGIPVVLIGTFKSLSLFQKSFSQARRSAGQGDMIWTNMANDEDWDFLLEGLWEYQVTNPATKLDPEKTRELYDVMYEESQGIIDIAVKLYMLVQWEVLGEKSEKITPSLIRSVAKKRLATLRPLLQALKIGDLDAIAKHEGLKDVVPDRDAMTEHLKRSQRRVYLGETQRTMRNQRENAQKEAGADALLVMVSDVVEQAGYEPSLALDASKKALERHAHATNIKLATREALRIAETCEAEKEAKAVSKKPKEEKKKCDTSLAGDLREIVNGSKKEKSPHQKCVDAGLIPSPEEVISGAEGL